MKWRARFACWSLGMVPASHDEVRTLVKELMAEEQQAKDHARRAQPPYDPFKWGGQTTTTVGDVRWIQT